VRKIYRVLPDADAAKHRRLRVIDESGEDYLYPADFFTPIELTAGIAEAFASASLPSVGRPREGQNLLIDLREAIDEFFEQVATGTIEIYNECSLQHELGIFLRLAMPMGQFKVQFERPVSFFSLNKSAFVKNEIDL